MNATVHHIRTQAVLSQAQQRLDDLSPPEPDEDHISQADADELARDMLAGTPYQVAWWLREECDDEANPLCFVRLTEVLRKGERELLVPELLTLLMCGYDTDLPRVRHLLRERFDAAHADVAKDDARRMLHEQDAELARWAEDSEVTQ
jgi:hypothetical protein